MHTFVLLLYIKKWLNVYHLLINIMYINVDSSPNSIIQYNSSSTSHKLFQGNYQITGSGPTQHAISTNPVFIIRIQNESQSTFKWLDSLTASEHSLNLVAYYHTLTTERIVQLYSVQFGFVWPHLFSFLR